MITITKEAIWAIAPKSKTSPLVVSLVAEMNLQFNKAGIDTKEEVRHFVAQAAHETDSFRSLIEYASGAEYEGRSDLGNRVPGYGKLFKGRGIFQTTGYSNYLHLTSICPDSTISFVDTPWLLQQPTWAVWSALVFWNDRHLSDIAMRSDKVLIYSKYLNKKLTPIEYITFRINGRQNGLAERKGFYDKAKKAFP
jgi:putative chitinase